MRGWAVSRGLGRFRGAGRFRVIGQFRIQRFRIGNRFSRAKLEARKLRGKKWGEVSGLGVMVWAGIAGVGGGVSARSFRDAPARRSHDAATGDRTESSCVWVCWERLCCCVVASSAVCSARPWAGAGKGSLRGVVRAVGRMRRARAGGRVGREGHRALGRGAQRSWGATTLGRPSFF